MALVKKQVTNFATYRGTPASDTLWDKLDWKFDARQVKIIVKAGSGPLEFSLDGKDVFGSLPAPEAGMNPMVYVFREAGLSRLFVRQTLADVEIYAYSIL